MLLAFCASTSILAGQDPAKKFTKVDQSEELFAGGYVPHVRIELGPADVDLLRKDPRKYVRCTFREKNSLYLDVAIHLKGNAAFRPVDDRPCLTLNFDKFVDGQRFYGLDKLHLNNSIQDPTYMSEIICGELFRAAGVPTPRACNVRLELNGRDLGLYVLKEGFDKTFLKRHFQNSKGNLYDPGFIKDINQPLEKDSGEDVPRQQDLNMLVSTAQEVDPIKRLSQLHRVLDVDRFLAFLAVEVMTWHRDGYALGKNNYRVYHDPKADKLIFMPHGMDLMFSNPNGPIVPKVQGLVAEAFLHTAEGRRRYREQFERLFTNVFNLRALSNRVEQLQSRIRPELVSLDPNAAKEHDRQVGQWVDLIQQRFMSLTRQLNAPPPQPPPFDSSGIALLSGWESQIEVGNATLDRTLVSGKPTLRIQAQGPCMASWQTTVVLQAGRYKFEDIVKTVAVNPMTDGRGEGAGLRIAGPPQPRSNSAIGDAHWKELHHEFIVASGPIEVVLVAELRATSGEAWFDAASLKLVRLERIKP